MVSHPLTLRPVVCGVAFAYSLCCPTTIGTLDAISFCTKVTRIAFIDMQMTPRVKMWFLP
jgi:hypothetical protein